MPLSRFTSAVPLALVVALTLAACSDDPVSHNPEPNPPSAPSGGACVFVVDAAEFTLISDAQQVADGLFRFEMQGRPDVPAVGDLLVSTADEGFLRRVTHVTMEANVLIVETEAGAVPSLVPQATLSLATTGQSYTMSHPRHGVSLGDREMVTLTDITVDEIKQLDGTLDAMPRLALHAEWLDYALTDFRLTGTVPFMGDLTVILAADQATHEQVKTYPLVTLHQRQEVELPGSTVPIILTAETHVDLEVSLTAVQPFSDTLSISFDHSVSLNYQNEDGRWVQRASSPQAHDLQAFGYTEGIYEWQIRLQPQTTVKLFGAALLTVDAASEFAFERSESGVGDWFVEGSTTNKQHTVGYFDVFGFPGQSQSRNLTGPPTSIYRAPATIDLISGAEQVGSDRTPLDKPIVVRVLDSEDQPVAQAHVRYQHLKGGGHFLEPTAQTNTQGYAENIWVMGDALDNRFRIFTGSDANQASAFVHINAQSHFAYFQPDDTGDGWPVGHLNEVGIDPEPLVDVANRIRQQDIPEVHSIVIVKDGKLVFETYGPGTSFVDGVFAPAEFNRERIHNLASSTKSVASALVGIAVYQGFIANDQVPLFDFFPDYADLRTEAKAAIKLRDVLNMSSGLQWDEVTCSYFDLCNDIRALWDQSDPVRYILAKDVEAAPGTKFVYNGGGTNLLGEVVRRTSGRSVVEFANEFLFGPLGITDYSWRHLANNVTYTSGDMRLRPRDMAKFGALYANGGVWEGQRILSEEWVKQTQHGVHLVGIGWTYGYQWWTHTYIAHQTGRAFSTFSTRGWGGQEIIVFPDENMVIVFTGGNYNSPVPINHILTSYILPAVQ